MNTYSDGNRPRGGNALKIWLALKVAGYEIQDLHYNPNLWGRGMLDGWGTWACQLTHAAPGRYTYVDPLGCFCGIQDGKVYLQGMSGQYQVVFL